MDHEPGCDFLSDLPLSIIHIILAFVSIKDAIRTCILSRQWRYIWTSLPHLSFTGDSASNNYQAVKKFEDDMGNFITHALFHHEGPIHKFQMSVPFSFSCPDIDEWVRCLSRKDIKEINLIMREGDSSWWHLHSSIYSCENLTSLSLGNCELDPPPSTFMGFLHLRHLSLQEVDRSSNGIDSLLANTPVLERLGIIRSESSELRITAPKLKYLCLAGDYIEICLDAPLLAELHVELDRRTFGDFTTEHKPQKSNYTNFMGGLTKLEKLRGHRYFTEYLSIGIESCHHSLGFHHLKGIDLREVNFEDIRQISVVARLIFGAPNLHIQLSSGLVKMMHWKIRMYLSGISDIHPVSHLRS